MIGNADRLEVDGTLRPCPFCGTEAGYRLKTKDGRHSAWPISVECCNSSCGVHTPEHYDTREKAAIAWNRRTTG